jgi:hypothetical protein
MLGVCGGVRWSDPLPRVLLRASCVFACAAGPVSGTSKQHVAFDYARRLSEGAGDAAVLTNAALECVLPAPQEPLCL